MSNNHQDSNSELDPINGHALVELIEVEPGVAILFADQPPAGFDLIPFDTSDKFSRADLLNGLSLTVGMGGMAMEAAKSALSAQGLVRLDPSTLELLKTTVPMMSEGKNLGALVGDSGKIVSLIRYSPAMDAQAALMVANVGPLAPLLMIQAQLVSISRRVDENIEITQSIIEMLRKEQWGKLQANHKSILRAVEEAVNTRGVSDHIFKKVVQLERDLILHNDLFTGNVRKHVQALHGTAKERRNYVEKNINEIIADTHGMLMAEGSWYRWCILRAANIARDSEALEENKILLKHHVLESKQTHSAAMESAYELITELERQCRLIDELPGSFFTRGRSGKTTADMAEALAENLAALRNQIRITPDPVDPTVVAFKEEVPQKVLRILRWSLPDACPLLALADVFIQRRLSEKSYKGYLGITQMHLFLSSQTSVNKQGMIDTSISLEDVRYVRFSTQDKQGPQLDIITKNEDFHITFDDWGASGEGLRQAERISDLLATTMNIPEGEKRSDPLMLPVVEKSQELNT
ncbi:hypothetical protein [Corynebacterium flavescens]|uniref:hypothetical protein n=1 Tax=Corynebacterium flavescens TaxID=28028 RepID=UPI003FD1D4A5